jgi:UDP-N-acetylmuramoylalanine--D-glutamate ligase
LDLSNKKIAIFGMGKSGVSALRLLHREKAQVYAVSLGDPRTWHLPVKDFIEGKFCFSQDCAQAPGIFAKCDLIILSPGIPSTHPCLRLAKGKVPIWSEIELGFHFCPIPIVAITGTNGKTTTVTLLGELLKSAGKKPFVGGNIGKPLCDLPFEKEDYDLAVLEVSSFQMEKIESFKPHVAAILNVTQNHGERYVSFEDYLQAKQNIARNQTKEDYLLIPKHDRALVHWAHSFSSNVVEVDPKKIPEMAENWDLTQFRLPGAHNLLNLFFCYKILQALGVEISRPEAVLSRFSGVEFRLQLENSPFPFKVYNDAKSTNYDSTLTAINALSDKKEDIYLILGGQKRGVGDSILPHILKMKKPIKKIFLIGETTPMLAHELKGHIPFEESMTLKHAVESVKKDKGFKGILLFSPGFPSFDQYPNYIARGKAMRELLCQI